MFQRRQYRKNRESPACAVSLFRHSQHCRRTYKDGLGTSVLAATHLEAALDTEIQGLEEWAAAVARLGLSIGTGAVFQAALLARAIIAPCASDIGSCVSNVGLAESSDKAFGSVLVVLHVLLEHPSGDTLVVTRSMGVVAEHGGAVNGVPRENTNVLAVRSSLEADEGESSISLGVISGTLLFGVVQVRPSRAVNGAIGDLGRANINVALFSQSTINFNTSVVMRLTSCKLS